MPRRRLTRRPDFAPSSGFGNAWDITIAPDDDILPPSQLFIQTLSGLATREVNAPDVFQHFFAAAPVIEAT